MAFDRREGEQLADFRFVQQEFAGGLGLMVLKIAVRVFVNVRVLPARKALTSVPRRTMPASNVSRM
jgi:hypothetical protein